jgi:prefoldin subunit 5
LGWTLEERKGPQVPAAKDLINRLLVQQGTEAPVLEMMAPALEAVHTLEEKFDALVAKVEELDKRLGEAEAQLAQIAAEQDQTQR